MSKNDDLPEIVERLDRSLGWKVFLVVIAVFVLLFGPQFFKSVSEKDTTAVQPGMENAQPGAEITPGRAGKYEVVVPGTVEPPTFENVLNAAIKYDREGNREVADKMFRRLLRETAQSTSYTPEMALLFPRAADFYSRGNEIPDAEVENLYLDAIDAMRQFRDANNYEYENVYRGLEKFYASHGRYKDAALQTRRLLDYYRNYRGDNKDEQYALILPATIRLGNHLEEAGQFGEARIAYQEAMDMTRTRKEPTDHIEDLIKKTYEKEKQQASRKDDPVVDANKASTSSRYGKEHVIQDVKSAIENISVDGVHVEKITEGENDRFTVTGYADENKLVAAYLRALQQKAITPTLNSVVRKEMDNKTVSAFSISVKKYDRSDEGNY